MGEQDRVPPSPPCVYRRPAVSCIDPSHVGSSGGSHPASIVLSLFWLGWTSYPGIHPAVPALSGLPFAAGYLLGFMALLNYVTDAYRQFSASAQAAASTARSITAFGLPLAAPRMYEDLGIQWACSLLAFLTLVLACVPFFFIRYGDVLRKRSPFCQTLSAEDGRNGESEAFEASVRCHGRPASTTVKSAYPTDTSRPCADHCHEDIPSTRDSQGQCPP